MISFLNLFEKNEILCRMFTLRQTLKIQNMIKVYEFGPYDVHIYWNYTMEMRSVHLLIFIHFMDWNDML